MDYLEEKYKHIRRFDRDNPPLEGIFYDGEKLFVARECDDDDVEEGCVGYLNYFMNVDLIDGGQHCDALYTGYHNLIELMDDVFTTDCAIVSENGYDAGTIAELASMMYDCEDRDLTIALGRAARILGEEETC